MVHNKVKFKQNDKNTCFCLQNEARKLNQQEVVEEDKKRKLPANWEAKKARLEWELAEDQKKKVHLYIFSPLELLKYFKKRK